MNKKIIYASLIIVTTLIIFSSVYAGILGYTNANIDVSSDTKATIDNIGVGEIQVTETICDVNDCRAWLWKWNDINQTEKYGLGSISFPARNCTEYTIEGEGEEEISYCSEYHVYTEEELTTFRDNAIAERLELTAGVITSRAENTPTEKIGNGEVTLR